MYDFISNVCQDLNNTDTVILATIDYILTSTRAFADAGVEFLIPPGYTPIQLVSTEVCEKILSDLNKFLFSFFTKVITAISTLSPIAPRIDFRTVALQ